MRKREPKLTDRNLSCVNEYKAEVKNGVFNETVIKSHTLDRDPGIGENGMLENITITIPPSGNRTEPTDYTMLNVAAAAISFHLNVS